MALITCKDCNQKFSSDSAKCVHCGARQPTKFLHIIGIILAAVIFWGMITDSRTYVPSVLSITASQETNTIPISNSECTIDNIGLSKIDFRIERQIFFVTGQIFNDCKTPTGVHVKITFTDSKGQIMLVEDRWPMSTRNLAVGSLEAFQDMMHMPQGNFEGPFNMNIRVVEVKQWQNNF